MQFANHLINQYSYIVISVFALLVSAVAAYVWLPLPAGVALVAVVVVALVGLGTGLRFRHTQLADLAELDEVIGKGRPVMVVVYSNY